MSTFYYLKVSVDPRDLIDKGWNIIPGEYEGTLLGNIKFRNKDFYLHFSLSRDGKNIGGFDRYGGNFLAAEKLIMDLVDLGYVYNDPDAEKAVIDEYKMQELIDGDE